MHRRLISPSKAMRSMYCWLPSLWQSSSLLHHKFDCSENVKLGQRDCTHINGKLTPKDNKLNVSFVESISEIPSAPSTPNRLPLNVEFVSMCWHQLLCFAFSRVNWVYSIFCWIVVRLRASLFLALQFGCTMSRKMNLILVTFSILPISPSNSMRSTCDWFSMLLQFFPLLVLQFCCSVILRQN